ncbi:MAG: pseudouridine synthase [Alphaproteobacteria bacterium]
MTAAAGKRAAAADAAERIAKVIARSGRCSRRDAEKLIAEGRVKLAGAVVTTPATLVRAGDPILVDDAPLPEREKARLWRYHKPEGLVTSHRDEKGRPTVFDRLPDGMPRVISVGRLDLTSEGLLLLTNDGELARVLELPSTGWKRRYRVRAFGRVTDTDLEKLGKGLTVDGVRYGPVEAALEREQGGNVWLTVSLREGKNREVRKVLEHLGLTVNRLIRIAYGPFQLGTLDRGAVEEVRRGVLRAQLGSLLPDGGGTEGAAVARPRPAPTPGERAARRRAQAKAAEGGDAAPSAAGRDRTPRAGSKAGGPRPGGAGHAHRRRKP